MSMSQRFSRRELLMRGGALGASALVAPLLARQGSGLLKGAVRPQATTTTVTYCTDSSLGPLIQPFVTKFNKQFAPVSAQLSLIPTNYETVLETKFAAGAPGIDMVLADPGYANYWYESGWTQALDGLPGLAQINADMSIPSLKPDLISSDGKQMAIPYYNGTVLFAYNKALLSKYDIAPPTTWAEFTAACTKMKKAGLDYPFAAFWDADFGIVFYNFLAHCASEGMTTGFNRPPSSRPSTPTRSPSRYSSSGGNGSRRGLWRRTFWHRLTPASPTCFRPARLLSHWLTTSS